MDGHTAPRPTSEELAEAFHIGERWVRNAKSGTGESDEDKEAWFGRLATTAVGIGHLLGRIRDDGTVALEPGETPPTFLRFTLFNDILGLVGYESYGWVTALDEYANVARIGERGRARERQVIAISGNESLAGSARDLRQALGALLGGLREQINPVSMGRVLRLAFIAACAMLIAIERALDELELREP